MVRRMLVRATTKSYNKIIAEFVKQLNKGSRTEVGAAVAALFREPGG